MSLITMLLCIYHIILLVWNCPTFYVPTLRHTDSRLVRTSTLYYWHTARIKSFSTSIRGGQHNFLVWVVRQQFFSSNDFVKITSSQLTDCGNLLSNSIRRFHRKLGFRNIWWGFSLGQWPLLVCHTCSCFWTIITLVMLQSIDHIGQPFILQ